MSSIANLTIESIKLMLKPIVKLCLQNSIGVAEIHEIIKSCLVESSKEEIISNKEKLNTSRISVMTGLQRRDVTRLLEDYSAPKESPTLVSRVIGQWENDRRFNTKSGIPKILTCEGSDSEFAKLVATVSKDVHHGTVLFELKRLGIVENTKAGIKLTKKTQNVSSDPRKAFQVVANDMADLITTTNSNLFDSEETPNLHARTEYDNVFREDIPEIREWLLKEGSEFHRKVREFLSQYDKDLNPHIKKQAGAKVSLSAFSTVKLEK